MGLCDIICGLRETVDRSLVEKKARELTERFGVKIHLLERPMLPVSSTMIRDLLGQGRPISGLVDPAVENYIFARKLYAPEEYGLENNGIE